MFKVRGALTVTAMSVLLFGGLIAPAVAQSSDELCGPYTGDECPEPQDDNGESDDTRGDSAFPDEDDSEIEGELIDETEDSDAEEVVADDDGAAAASDESQVLGTTLARTGIEAWMLSLIGLLLLGGGVAVLAGRRREATID